MSDFFDESVLKVNVDDLDEDIEYPSNLNQNIKEELEKKVVPDDENRIVVDVRQIEKILNLNNAEHLQYTKKNISLPNELYEEVKLLGKYEEINSSKLILKAIKNYVENRRVVLDKIYELKGKTEAN